MVGVGYGKGISLPEEQVRWVTPDEADARLARGERIRFFDARDPAEFDKGSLPGAESLPQSTLMFNRAQVQPLIDELVAGGGGAADLVFFANTAGPNSGMTAGREVFVIAFLMECGLPLARMARLSGGLHGWTKSGRPTPPPALASMSAVDSLATLIAEAGLPDISRLSTEVTLGALVEKLGAGRPTLLSYLKESGVERLADRQRLANVLAKANRAGHVST